MLLSMTTRRVTPRKIVISSSACGPELMIRSITHVRCKTLQFLGAGTELIAIAQDLI